MQGCLKFGIEDIKKTVCETPKEEEDGDQSDREDRLLDGEGRSASQPLVGNSIAAEVNVCLRRAMLSVVDFVVHIGGRVMKQSGRIL